MKSVLCYLLGLSWIAASFCGCGGGPDTSVSVNVDQSQNQNASAASSSVEADPCQMCSGTIAEVTDCLDGFGMEPSDCE